MPPGNDDVSLRVGVVQDLSEAVAEMKASLDTLQSEFAQTGASAAASSRGVDELDDELDQVRNSAATAAGSLTAFNAASSGVVGSGVADEMTEAVGPLTDFGDRAGNTAIKVRDIRDELDDAAGSFRQIRAITDPDIELPFDDIDADNINIRELQEKLEERGEDIRFQYKGETDLDPGESLSDAQFREFRERVGRKMREELGDADFGPKNFTKRLFSTDDVDIDRGAQPVDALEASLDKRISKMGNLLRRDKIPRLFRAFDEAVAEEGPDFRKSLAPDEIGLAEAMERVNRETSAHFDDLDKMFVDVGAKSTIKKDTEEAIAIAQETAGSIKLAAGPDLEETQRNVNNTVRQVEEGATTINLNMDIPEGAKAEVFAELKAFVKALEGTEDIDLDIDVDASDSTLELIEYVAALDAANAAALAAMVSNRGAADSIDKVGDEAKESAAEMGLLASIMNLASFNMTALSFNVGAFNIALSNLSKQIPMLLASLGTLATGLMGVAGAAIVAAVGIAGIVGGGVLAQMSDLEENVEGVESKSEALQAIMMSLAEAFERALEPLKELNGSSEVFFNMINSLLETTNMFAKGIADSFRFTTAQFEEFIAVGQEMGIITDEMLAAGEAGAQFMSLGGFMDEIGQIWSDNLNDIVVGTQIMSAFLLPILADLLRFFIEGFDDMAIFVTHFTNELASVGPALKGLLDFAVELIRLGSRILQGLLPVFVGLISLATGLASAFNELNPEIIRSAAFAAALAAIGVKLGFMYIKLAAVIGEVIAGTKLHATWMALQNVKAALLAGNISKLGAVKLALNVINQRLLMTYQGLITAITAQNTLLSKAIMWVWSKVTATGAWILAQSSLLTALWGSIVSLGGYISGLITATAAEYAFLAPLIPIVVALGALTLAGLAAIAVLTNLSGSMDFLSGIMDGLKTILGVLINVYLNYLIIVFNVLATIIDGVIFFFSALWNTIDGFTGGALSAIVDEAGALLDILVDLFTSIPSMMMKGADMAARAIESLISMLPDGVKMALGLEPGEFDFGRTGKGLRVSRDEVLSGASDAGNAIDNMTARGASNFNYNEENIQNNAMEVNADPEKQEQLKRVIKDAMEEANSQSRRQQGHPG